MFYILLFAVYGFLIYFKPKYGLALILIFLPTYQIKFQIAEIPFTFLEIMILISFFCWAIKKWKNLAVGQLRDLLDDWFLPICLWLLVSTTAVFIAPDLRAAAGVWRAYFVEPILFLLVLLDLAENKMNKESILDIIFFGLSVSAFGCSIWAVLQKWFGGGVWSMEVWGQPEIWRATGPFSHPNFLGLYLAPAIILGIGILIANARKNFGLVIYYSLFIILTFWALVLTRSEGAMVGMVAGLLFLGIIFKKSRKYVLIGLAAAILLVAICPASRYYILEKAFLRDLSGEFRLNIWSGAVSLLETSPIFGVGLDGYEKLIVDYQANNFVAGGGQTFFAPIQPYPHNLFLAVWLELGLAGMIIFIWILIKFFRRGFKNVKNNAIISSTAMGMMVCVLVHGLVDTPYFKNDLAIVFWLIVGLGIILGNLKKDGMVKKESLARSKI